MIPGRRYTEVISREGLEIAYHWLDGQIFRCSASLLLNLGSCSLIPAVAVGFGPLLRHQ
jgi:hypothetical protein